ncbi:hypothetical protein TWF696_004743 [Orbilia brochopaga]|uniref:CFEM domain-containing protein n=1 Tax=Orbilia brochopaga TaxID=3140254 RepID=A0AAV9UZI7_9PEZI
MKTLGAIIFVVSVFCAGLLRLALAQFDSLGLPPCALPCAISSSQNREFCPDFEFACACIVLGSRTGSIRACLKSACNQTDNERTNQIATEVCQSVDITLGPFTSSFFTPITSPPSIPTKSQEPSTSSPGSNAAQTLSTSNSSSPSSSETASQGKSGLSGGAIAGIVVGIVVPLTGIIAFIAHRMGIFGGGSDTPVVPLQNDPEMVDYGGIRNDPDYGGIQSNRQS